MSDPITRDDLWELETRIVDRISAQMKMDGDSIRARLDTANGRTNKLEAALTGVLVSLGRIRERMRTVEQVVLRRRSDKPMDDDKRPLTRGELRIVGVVLGIVGTVVLTIWKVLPALLKAVKVLNP